MLNLVKNSSNILRLVFHIILIVIFFNSVGYTQPLPGLNLENGAYMDISNNAVVAVDDGGLTNFSSSITGSGLLVVSGGDIDISNSTTTSVDLKLEGSSNQTVVLGSVTNLIIDHSAVVNVMGNAIISGDLTIDDGTLAIGASYQLSAGGGVTNSGTITGDLFLNGNGSS